MTFDEIMSAVKERFAGKELGGFVITVDEMEGIFRLIKRMAHEECAMMFDGEVWSYDYREIAAAIRARGQQ